MKVKVCGLFDPGNISEIVSLSPDYIGYIFYEKSPRYLDLKVREAVRLLDTSSVRKVGVFVQESSTVIFESALAFNLNAVQLHGESNFHTAEQLRENGFLGEIFLALTINQVELCNAFHPTNDIYFLFDTPTELHGGSGKQFDWSKLSQYKGKTPFFLSGGIGPDNLEEALKVEHEKFVGIDLNSKLESDFHFKDIKKTNFCIQKVREYETR